LNHRRKYRHDDHRNSRSTLRVALGNCVNAGKDVSPAERSHFAAAQNDSSDEEVVSFWLSVSVGLLSRQASSTDVYRQAVGAKSNQYQRVDGALGTKYCSTGKQLTSQLFFGRSV